MLDTLYFYGIRGENTDWFRSYLSNRKRKFEIKAPYAINFFVSLTGINLRAFVVHNANTYKCPPLKINNLSESKISADDTSVIISKRNSGDFCTMSKLSSISHD